MRLSTQCETFLLSVCVVQAERMSGAGIPCRDKHTHMFTMKEKKNIHDFVRIKRNSRKNQAKSEHFEKHSDIVENGKHGFKITCSLKIKYINQNNVQCLSLL